MPARLFNSSAFIPGILVGMLVLLSVTIPFRAGAQTMSGPEPAQQTIITYRTDTTAIIKAINESVSVLISNKDSGKRLMFAAIDKSRRIGFARGIFLGYARIGAAYYNDGVADSAVKYLEKSVRTTTDVKLLKHYGAIMANNIGAAYQRGSHYSMALAYFEQTLASLGAGSAKNETTDSMGVYGNIGLIWSSLKSYNVARTYFHKMRELAVKEDHHVRLATAYHNIATAYLNEDNLVLAEQWFCTALDVEHRHSIYMAEMITLENLSVVARKRKKFDQALAYIDQARAVPGFNQMQLYYRQRLSTDEGRIYLYSNQLAKAKKILLAVYKQGQQTGMTQTMVELQYPMWELYEKEGNYQAAFRHLKTYSETRDSLLEKEAHIFLELWGDMQLKAKDKLMLGKELHIARQQGALQQKNMVIGGVLAGALMLIVVIFALVRNRQRKEAVIIHLRQSQELNQLKAQMRGEEQERQRIAHELHDGIASRLWGIQLSVDTMNRRTTGMPTQELELSYIYQQLSEASQDVRRTAHNLLPDLLLEEGIVTALGAVCETVRRNTQLEVDFLEFGVIPEMDKDIELSIYRMVQELIQNVLKHARGATNLLLQISCVDSLINITVEDNGCSFALPLKSEGSGLQQIRKRAQGLKGRFELENIPGKGTTVYLEFDIQYLL